MSVPMFGQTFTLAQMEESISRAYRWGKGSFTGPREIRPESIALIVSEVTSAPLDEVQRSLERLAEWRENQKDHPL